VRLFSLLNILIFHPVLLCSRYPSPPFPQNTFSFAFPLLLSKRITFSWYRGAKLTKGKLKNKLSFSSRLVFPDHGALLMAPSPPLFKPKLLPKEREFFKFDRASADLIEFTIFVQADNFSVDRSRDFNFSLMHPLFRLRETFFRRYASNQAFPTCHTLTSAKVWLLSGICPRSLNFLPPPIAPPPFPNSLS